MKESNDLKLVLDYKNWLNKILSDKIKQALQNFPEQKGTSHLICDWIISKLKLSGVNRDIFHQNTIMYTYQQSKMLIT